MPAITTFNYANVTVIYFVDRQIMEEVKINSLYKEIVEVVDTLGGGKLLLNFNNVQFLGSAFLGKLVALNKKCTGADISLKLSNLSPQLMEIFKVVHMQKMFDIHADEAKAIAAFSKKKWFS